MSQVTIDGQIYELESLSDNAKLQLRNLQIVDEEIRRLQMQMAIAQTARAAYSSALKSELPAANLQ
jgi:hypothetical protein